MQSSSCYENAIGQNLSYQKEAKPMSASFVSLSNIIIDDIVLHDGRTFMGVLGGAGIHALSGMRLWTKAELGLVASVGDDFERAHCQKFEQMGVSFEGIFFRKNQPTTRAWQIIEVDERRIEIMRADEIALPGYQPAIEEIPQSFLSARGYHLHLDDQLEMFPRLLDYLRENNPAATVLWEPTAPASKYDSAYLKKLLSLVSIFSPNLVEARLITGLSEEKEMIRYLFEHGAQCVALRMGSQGSCVYADADQGVKIPAIAKKVVDVTGAGNAYCGGFLVAIVQGLSLEEAGLRGAVSGSFEIEQFGVPASYDDNLMN
jgi:sugar/nucleoside kinase (ribokinase family)